MSVCSKSSRSLCVGAQHKYRLNCGRVCCKRILIACSCPTATQHRVTRKGIAVEFAAHCVESFEERTTHGVPNRSASSLDGVLVAPIDREAPSWSSSPGTIETRRTRWDLVLNDAFPRPMDPTRFRTDVVSLGASPGPRFERPFLSTPVVSGLLAP